MSSGANGKFAGRRLVVFGSGYVGGLVAEQALARGMSVTALTRNRDAARALRRKGIDTVVADLACDAWHDRIPASPEFAVDCVGAAGADAAGYRHAYDEGMRSILDWTRSRGRIGTFIFTSSTGVYPQSGGVRVRESDATWDPEAIGGGSEREDDRFDSKQRRGRILVAAERRLVDSHRACARWFVLRLAGIYGPGRRHLVEQVRSGTVSGARDTHLNLIHRDDAASAIWACFAAPEGVGNEIFNVVDDEPVARGEVVSRTARKLGVPDPEFTGGPFRGRVAPTFDRIIENAKLKALLGWKPGYRTFEHGFSGDETPDS